MCPLRYSLELKGYPPSSKHFFHFHSLADGGRGDGNGIRRRDFNRHETYRRLKIRASICGQDTYASNAGRTVGEFWENDGVIRLLLTHSQ